MFSGYVPIGMHYANTNDIITLHISNVIKIEFYIHDILLLRKAPVGNFSEGNTNTTSNINDAKKSL